MKMKRWKIFVAVVAVVIIGMAIVIFLNLPKPLSTSDNAYNLSQLTDGTYTGNCDNGIVKVQVEVEVQGNAITTVHIVNHQNGLGSSAEAITVDIVEQQSVEVDAVSGATMSSKTILKAVENALSGTGE